MRNKGRAAAFVLESLAFTLALCLFAACSWIDETLHINFTELLYTLVSPLTGAGESVVSQIVQAGLFEIGLILLYVFVGGVVLLLRIRLISGGFLVRLTVRIFSRRWKFDVLRLLSRLHCLMAAISAAALIGSLWYADRLLSIREYIRARTTSTTLYDEYYVDPAGVEITGGGKNLIYIYLESMETAYAPEALGGYQPEINYIPLLTELARQNISFSNSTQLGGFRSITGTTWTMGAMFATTAGIPFSFPVEQNSTTHGHLASGVTALGDILAAKGYQNEFLCGSRAEYAGRQSYLVQHGNYKIFDIFTARETGYVAPDYHNGHWGYDDQLLYEIAKDELLALAQSGTPFNVTLLTVDTHFPNGYICSLCEDSYETVAENVVACADRQAASFIQWCQQQDFYEDTVIVVIGDHPRMDTCLVDGADFHDRTVYNCILNCGLPARTENREFTAMDMLPTTLAAMGFEIEGNRLGLGTNLFSEENTLAESMGYDVLEGEIQKYSSYYVRHFA